VRWLALLAATSTFTLHLGQTVVLPNAKVGDTVACVGLHGRVTARVTRRRTTVSRDYLRLAMRPVLQGGIAAECVSTRAPSWPPLGFEPTAASFISPSRGWELGVQRCESCDEIRATTDGGRTWHEVSRPVFHPYWFSRYTRSGVSDLAFADGRDGFAFGQGLYATHDGGRTWRRVQLPPVEQLGVGAGYAFALTDAKPYGAGAMDLWRSPAGRDRWQLVGQFFAPFGMSLVVDGPVVALLRHGAGAEAPGGLWVSATSWSRWQRFEAPCRSEAQGATALGLAQGDAARRWLVDCWDNEQSSQEQHTLHHLYGTADAGRSWRLLGTPSHDGAPALVTETSSGAIFMATEAGGTDEFHASFNAGRTFATLFHSGGADFGWADLHFLNSRIGFVVGPTHYAPEHVYRTDDGGRHWRLIDSG
jgi:hypothetical protein